MLPETLAAMPQTAWASHTWGWSAQFLFCKEVNRLGERHTGTPGLGQGVLLILATRSIAGGPWMLAQLKRDFVPHTRVQT